MEQETGNPEDKSGNNKDWFDRQAFKLNLAVLAVTFLGAAFLLFQIYPEAFSVKAEVSSNSQKLNPKDSITINFSRPMLTESVAKGFSIYPADPVVMKWENKNKTLIVAPKNHWKLETKYTVNISKAQSIMFIRLPDKEINFETIGYPKITNFMPANDAQDVLIDIEDPITAEFDRDVRDFDIKFKFNPQSKFTWKLAEDNKTISIVPVDKLVQGQRYEVSIFARHIIDRPTVEDQESIWEGEGAKEIYKSAFTTKPLPEQVWSSTLEQRLRDARTSTKPAILEGKYIDINLTAQVMTLFENGRLLDAYLVSSGKAGMGTPQGQFKIYTKHPRPWSKKYGLYMPFWNAFTPSGSHGIHELPEWPGGYKEGQNHLGIPVSHGCVRLGIGPAERVYNWAYIGTPVVIHK